MELAFDAQAASGSEKEVTGVLGGLLVQNQDIIEENPADWQVVTKRQPSEQERVALEFAWKSVKYVKSNGIIITNDRQVLGVGPGQTNRVASVKIAIEQAKDRLDGAALASDAFFPLRIISRKSQPLASKLSSSLVAPSVMRNLLLRLTSMV